MNHQTNLSLDLLRLTLMLRNYCQMSNPSDPLLFLWAVKHRLYELNEKPETKQIAEPELKPNKQKAKEIAKTLTKTQKMIFLHIGKRCKGSKFGRCFEFKANIAKACGVSKRTVFNELKNLEKLLLIVRTKEHIAGSFYRKSVIALRSELSEIVYHYLLRQQRKEKCKQAKSEAQPSQVVTEPVASDSQKVASRLSPQNETIQTPETKTEDEELIEPPAPDILAKIYAILRPMPDSNQKKRTLSPDFDDWQILSVLSPEERHLLYTQHRASVIKRAEAKLNHL